MSRIRVRAVYISTTAEAEVECCEHCHGDPEECHGDPPRPVEPEGVVVVAEDPVRALHLLQQAYAFVAGETLDRWQQQFLRHDLQQFLDRCGVQAGVKP